MKKEVIILLFIIGFAGVVYLLIRSSESSLQSDMKNPTESPKQVTTPSAVKSFPKAPEMIIDAKKKYTATLKTNMGNIEIALNAKGAPKTVNNFVFLAKKDFYDGTIFHRVIKDFMIQGGDPEGTGMGGPGYKFEDEITAEQVFSKAGLLAMANAGPNTNGSQFFITHKETPWLTGNHTIFGEVVKGMDVVDKIANVATGNNDKPLSDVIITDVEIKEQ
jgi:peptidyl-prolyl cis-trans isomerase B (cyclophilin B)